jgi:hypothetical protein
VGLWQFVAPAGATVYIRANMTAWTSGSVMAFVAPVGVPNGCIMLPWSYSVTSGQNIIGPIDVSGMSEVSLYVTALTTTVIIPYGTIDPTLTTWTTIAGQYAISNSTSSTLSSSGVYRVPTGNYKWIQYQVTTTGTALTIQGAQAKIGTNPVLSSAGNSIGVASVQSSSASAPILIADQASATINSTATSAAITPNAGCEYETNAIVTAVSGTSPTLDIVLQESDDNGVNWFDVYHFPRITAVGAYRSPKIIMKGYRYRTIETVGGTSPSFTRSRNRLQGSSGITGVNRRIFDRAVSLTTLNATTTTAAGNPLNVSDCRNLQLTIAVGAVTTTAPALQLQGSEDGGATWTLIGSPLVAVASSTVSVTVSNVNWEFVRAIVTTAGVGVTANFVAIKGF